MSCTLQDRQKRAPEAASCYCCCILLMCRLKEFTERWEVDKYLSATGYLPGNVKPFFIALPKVRCHFTATCPCDNTVLAAISCSDDCRMMEAH